MTGTAAAAENSPAVEAKSKGSLTIVGVGIQALGQLTPQARANINSADAVFYLVTEPIAEHYIQSLNSNARSLFSLYAMGKERKQSYEEMVEAILSPVREGHRVCVAFYGHPGVFVFPSHEAIWRARSEGYAAEMLPAISAEDCLWADLGIDPGIPGCQSYEATDFLIFQRKFDSGSALILWQIGVIGLLSWWEEDFDNRVGLEVLTDELLRVYPPDHPVVVYEAANLLTQEPRLTLVKLKELPSAEVTTVSTLYIPPASVVEPDNDMLLRLGIEKDSLSTVVRQVTLNRPPFRSLGS